MKLGADRYSFKADDYSKYRPEFPSQVIEFLYSQSDISRRWKLVFTLGRFYW